jgi:hypothetical protein
MTLLKNKFMLAQIKSVIKNFYEKHKPPKYTPKEN